MRAIPSASLPGAVPEAFASPAARPESRSFMSRVRDRAAALVGSKTRTALMALGLGLGLGGGAAAEDAAKMDAPSAAGAKMEMVTPGATVDKPAASSQNPVVNLADLLPAKPAAGSPDAAPAGIVLAMNDSAPVAGNQGQGQGRETDVIPESIPASAVRIVNLPAFVGNNKTAVEYGLTKGFQDSIVAYHAKMDAWRKSDPASARNYERCSGEVLSAYVLEHSFAWAPYPDNVSDPWNRGERIAFEKVGTSPLDALGLRTELPKMFTLGIDEAWAERQARIENPAALDDDGKYKAEVILEDAKDSMDRRSKRWISKFWPKDAAEAKSAQDARFAEKAAASVSAMRSLYARSALKNDQREVNPAVTVAEMTAAMSWIAAKEGFAGGQGAEAGGEIRMPADPLALQQNLATLTVAYWARREPKRIDDVPVLHVGRVKDVSPVLGGKPGNVGSDYGKPYSAQLISKLEKGLPTDVWKDIRGQFPATEEGDGAERAKAHDEATLRLAADDSRVPTSLRREIRVATILSRNIPLVTARDVMGALAGISEDYAKFGLGGKPGSQDAMTGAPGSPEYERDLRFVAKLIPLAFADAMGLPKEIDKERVDSEAVNEATRRADESGRQAAAQKELGSLMDSYEKEADAGKRLAMVRRMNEILESERVRIEKTPKDQWDEGDKKIIAQLLPVFRAKFAQELSVIAKNG